MFVDDKLKGNGAKNKKKVFIVGVSETAVFLLSEMLEGSLYMVTGTASNCSEAVEKITGTNPDAVIMDIKLEGAETGFDAAKKIKKVIKIPVVYTSSYFSTEILESIRKTGGQAYIMKPVRRNDLIAALDIAIWEHNNIENLEEIMTVQSKNINEKLNEIQKYEFMVNATSEFMTLISKDYIYESANDAYCRAHGKERSEIVGKTVAAIWGKTIFNQKIKLKLDECLSGREVYYHEWLDFGLKGKKLFGIYYYPYRRNGKEVSHVAALIRDITWRKKAEEKLKNSEEFNRQMIESSEDCIKVLDLKGRLLYMSPGGQKLMEIRDIKPYLNKSWIDFWQGEDNIAAKKAVKKALVGGIGNFEGFCKTASGKPKWWSVKITPIKGAGGKIETLLAISRDITEKKNADWEIKNLALFPEQNSNPVYRISKDGVLLYANPAARKLILKGVQASVGEKIPEKWIKPIREIFDSGKQQTVENELGRRLYLFSSVPVVESGYVDVYAIDITERQKAEAKLKEKHYFSESIINTAQAIILVLDNKGRIVRFNHYMEELSGYRLEEVKGKDWFSTFLPKEDQKDIREVFKQAVTVIKTKGRINPILTKTGRQRLIEWYDERLKDSRGNITGLLAIGHDITEKKMMEKSIRQQEKLVSIGRLAAGVVHELNNPLTTVIARVDLLAFTGTDRLSAEDKEELAIIKGEGLRMKKIIGDLQTFSKKSVTNKKTMVSLNDIIRKVQGLMSSDMTREGIKINNKLPDIPFVKAEPDKIMQVFINLLSNSKDSLSDPDRKNNEQKIINISTEYLSKKNLVRIKIKDNGAGLNEKTQNSLFDPFFTTKEKGTGLGLSITYGIVKDHGGNIHVESREDEYTEFVIELPAENIEERGLTKKQDAGYGDGVKRK